MKNHNFDYIAVLYICFAALCIIALVILEAVKCR